ncbi:TIGR02391 family protein [Demequina lutea]|uniref:Conserved hypothetical protein CHP02391 domain-containing protein n=1 Tax=Demequina lutea TaxID=431489 RepID=A0A7Z0CJ44_9MICO|nr:TIGR02391 family protein [Demequina lutea]NYI40352.1 hypothetical protein [Demequina lutea]
MDIDWARTLLNEYVNICERLTAHQKANRYDWDETCRQLDNEAIARVATITHIIRELDPEWRGPLDPPSLASGDGERIVRRALGALNDREQWPEYLAPDSPKIRADKMHPVVWDAASVVWETGEYRLAVQQAAVSLSAHIKARVRSPLSDRDLVQQVFSPDPPRIGQTRLHFDGDSKDKTWQSRQQGLHLVAQGAFAGLRNVATHDVATWEEGEALEYLAVMSVVARWADETKVVRHT